MKRIVLFLSLTLFAATTLSAQTPYVPSPENLAAREKFSEARFGVFIHWGVYSMLADGEWIMNNNDIPYDEYKNFASGFYPSKFDAREWVRTFKAAGAKYITITSRHHDGFSMFGTKASPYNIVDATPFKRDVLKELAEACAEEGLTLNFYYSHLDWGRNDYWPLGNTGHESGRPDGDESSWGHYLDFMCAQLTELLTNYGPIGCIWFDGIWDKTLPDHKAHGELWQLRRQYDLIHSLQPACLVGNNHHLPVFEGEDIQIFEKDVPGKNTAGFSGTSKVSDDLPLETCQTIYNAWGYSVTDREYKSPEYLVRYLVETAGKGANLLLNIGPRPDGTLPGQSVERLLFIGKWLEKYGGTIYGTKGGCVPEQSWGVTTQKDNKLFVHVLDGSKTVFLPMEGEGKVVSAVAFDDGSKVQFTRVREGIVLTVPDAGKEVVDRIVTLTFKNPLP